jgi:DNA-binding NarL/FixJ family response regulator
MPNLSNTVSFLFAGDGSLASEGLCLFLQTKSNFLMVSECGDGARAIAEIETHRPEIAVIDAQLPDLTAAQIIEAVRNQNRQTKIIVLGATADRNLADQLLAAGADAYIVRNGPSRHLNDAIRYVRDGGKYLAPELTKDLPVAAEHHALAVDHSEAVNSLRAAVEAQARTVDRLETAMDRAQYAIEILQQKVEQLSGIPIDPPPAPQPDENGRNRILSGMRSNLGAVAAALMVGVLGFLLAGILHPSTNPWAELASLGTEDALKANSTPDLHLAGWELETVARASALLKNQKYEAAEKVCRSLLQQDPANTAASRVLASALYHQDRIEESANVVRSMAVPPTPHAIRQNAPRLSFDN